MKRVLRWQQILLGLMVVLGLCRVTSAEPPFVAGFDRFARHDDIDRISAGDLLLSELSCTACHTTKSAQLQPKRGPHLDGIADRVGGKWIAQFLSSPSTTKPGTTMPDMLAGVSESEKPRVIEALAAFLSTQHRPYPVIKAGGVSPVPFEFWNKGRVELGKGLYHQVGCVACHDADEEYEIAEIKPSQLDDLLEKLDPEDLAEMGLSAQARRVNSVPHADLPTKYTLRSLTFFLLNPESIRPSGRMPSLKLTPVEAADIATYLLRKQQQLPVEQVTTSEALIEEGRRLFTELRCVNCHSVKGAQDSRLAKPLTDLNSEAKQNCYATPQRGLPHYPLDDLQHAAIQAALTRSNAEKQQSAVNEVQSRMLRLNCYACHERDKRGGVGRYRRPYFETVGHVDIGDEGRLPPQLTGVGRKLLPDWLNQVFQGKGDVRPHMHIRMPKFPKSAVESLPNLLIRTDSGKHSSEKGVFGDRKNLAEVGRDLMNVGCVECHQFRGETLPGTIGVDLQGVAQRVQPQWFHDFLLNPEELKNRTRMPTFFPSGKSQNKEILEGDTELQIAAMWAYLKQIDKQPLPEKIVQANSQDFELVPKDRPIVLRTFMPQAGTHAIAVGFASGVHYAFDAETIRLAQSWRGRFLDAQGTWFMRFTPPAEPLGEALINLPAGRPFAILRDKQQAWPKDDAEENGYRFSGYRLDEAGVPTLLYRFNQFDVEDRIEPLDNRQLTRKFTIHHRKSDETIPSLWLRAHSGKSLVKKAAGTFESESGLMVSASGNIELPGELRKNKNMAEWILPLKTEQKTTIEVQYRW